MKKSKILTVRKINYKPDVAFALEPKKERDDGPTGYSRQRVHCGVHRR